jgi:hypothetical protein
VATLGGKTTRLSEAAIDFSLSLEPVSEYMLNYITALLPNEQRKELEATDDLS